MSSGPVLVAEVVESASETDTPVRARPPVVTIGLIVACLLMALAQVAASGMRVQAQSLGAVTADFALGAKVSSLVRAGEYWRLVTSAFLHADWAHLLMNLIVLLSLGMATEQLYGRARTFVIYILACVTGGIASYLYTPAISLGASGGLMGLFGALFAHHIRYRSRLSEQAQRRLSTMVTMLVLVAIVDSVLPVVDRAGHAGGFFGGLVLGLLLAGRIEGEEQAGKDWLPLPTGMITATALVAYGFGGLILSLPASADLLRAAQTRDPKAQAEYVARVIERRPGMTELRLALCSSLLNANLGAEAVVEYERLIREEPGVVESGPGKFMLLQLLLWHENRAKELLEKDQWEPALPILETLIRHEIRPPNKANAYNSYAWGLADQLERDLDKAQEYAQRATDLAPKNPAYVDTLAWVYYKKGRYQEALDLQQFAVREASETDTRPDIRAELYYHLGAILEKLGRRDQAIANYVAALRHAPRFTAARVALRRLAPDRPEAAEPPPGRRRSGTPLDPAVERGIL